jgi:hypothetical protein
MHDPPGSRSIFHNLRLSGKLTPDAAECFNKQINTIMNGTYGDRYTQRARLQKFSFPRPSMHVKDTEYTRRHSKQGLLCVCIEGTLKTKCH